MASNNYERIRDAVLHRGTKSPEEALEDALRDDRKPCSCSGGCSHCGKVVYGSILAALREGGPDAAWAQAEEMEQEDVELARHGIVVSRGRDR